MPCPCPLSAARVPGYSHTGGHTSDNGVHQMCVEANSPGNMRVLFEYTLGPDQSHYFSVWNREGSSHATGDPPGSSDHWGWMGVSGC